MSGRWNSPSMNMKYIEWPRRARELPSSHISQDQEMRMMILISECDEYIRIFIYFWSKYLLGYLFVSLFLIRIYLDIGSCQLFGYGYIQIFVRGKILIRIYSDICSHQFSGHKQIQKMFLLIFSGYYTLLMDILLILMIKNAI